MAMKSIMIVCGSGIATSTLGESKIKDYLQTHGLADQVRTYKGNIAEYIGHIDDYDAFVSMTMVPDYAKDRVINGVPLLTGIGEDEVYQQIAGKLGL